MFVLFVNGEVDVTKYLFNKQEHAMEWFKFDHDWILVEEEMTYYNHLKDIKSYTTISIDPSSVGTSHINTKLINLGVNVDIRLPALAFKMYYCYTIDGKGPRQDQCQIVNKSGTTSFKSPLDLKEFETGKHLIEANLMILRSELLNSFCVRKNEEECSKNRKLQKEYPLHEDFVVVDADIVEVHLLSHSSDL